MVSAKLTVSVNVVKNDAAKSAVRCPHVTDVIFYLGHTTQIVAFGRLGGKFDAKNALAELRKAPKRFKKGGAWGDAALMKLVAA